jgi:hypothetical protein
MHIPAEVEFSPTLSPSETDKSLVTYKECSWSTDS